LLLFILPPLQIYENICTKFARYSELIIFQRALFTLNVHCMVGSSDL